LLTEDDVALCYLVYKLEGQQPQAIHLGSHADFKLALDVFSVFVLEILETGRIKHARWDTSAWRDLIADHTVVTQDQTKALLALPCQGGYKQGISFPVSPIYCTNHSEPYWVDERGVPIDALDRWWLDGKVVFYSSSLMMMKDSDGTIQKEPLFHSLVLTSYMRLILRHFPGVGFGFIHEPRIRRSPKWQPDRPLHLRWHRANPGSKSKYQGLKVEVRPAACLQCNANMVWPMRVEVEGSYIEFIHYHEALWYYWAESILEILDQLPAQPLGLRFSPRQQVRALGSLRQAASTVKEILERGKVNRILIQ